MGAAKEDGKLDLNLKTLGEIWWKYDGLGSEFNDTVVECSGVSFGMMRNKADGLEIKWL